MRDGTGKQKLLGHSNLGDGLDRRAVRVGGANDEGCWELDGHHLFPYPDDLFGYSAHPQS